MVPIFGEKLPGYKYERRRGCYAVIIDSMKQKTAVVATTNGHYFLPGGGMDEGESAEACLHREVLEETGYRIKIVSLIGEAKSYFFSLRKEPILSDAIFFTAEFTAKVQEPVDADHYLRWMKIEDAEQLLFHEHQKWAVRRAIEQSD